MIETITNANFPKDTEGRVYHVSVKEGDVANRVLTVGDHVRARKIAKLLDSEEETGHPIFERSSQRGFLTITGRYKGVPVSIMAIGMGNCMMDFFVRETRAIVEGTLAIIRFGSCGSLSTFAQTGSVMVPKAGYCIRRNIDYFAEDKVYPDLANVPYFFSGTFKADEEITSILSTTLEKAFDKVDKKGEKVGPVFTDCLNADADSFYSTQGREDPDFNDHNTHIIEEALSKFPETQSLEMETSMLFHLARCSKKPIKAAGCMQVFADRVGNSFIRPEQIEILEPLVGKACLDALIQVSIEDEMEVAGTVWESRHN